MKTQLVLKDFEYIKFGEFIQECQIRGFTGINNYDRHIYHIREQMIRYHINELAKRVGKGTKRHLTLSFPEIVSIKVMKNRIEYDDSIRKLMLKIINMDKLGL